MLGVSARCQVYNSYLNQNCRIAGLTPDINHLVPIVYGYLTHRLEFFNNRLNELPPELEKENAETMQNGVRPPTSNLKNITDFLLPK